MNCRDNIDVHETAAGALWNLAFNPGNALRIVEDGGVPALVHLCSSSVSKMARFMAALALAYMFDGRMDEFALIGTSSESTSKSVSLDGARRMALKHIEAFVLTFSDPQAFSTAAVSSAPAALTQVTESARIQEAGHLRCSSWMGKRDIAIKKLIMDRMIVHFYVLSPFMEHEIRGYRNGTHVISVKKRQILEKYIEVV
ncbi:hypothetical protein RJ640_007483 [Escallonia rubra]|uniref:Uncharacterized protein n=1 Tax=Escallonia rubra TaxID=112253 RepID=A0AA88UP97_9ASTE|nr:hypothetical protein RJ640_007483 [Escallonia rubra]